MKLQIKQRENQIKKEAKRARRDGLIPAVLYSKGKENRSILVQCDEFEAHLRATPKGYLSSKKFVLEGEGVNGTQAIVKEIQYHPTTYRILHIDFLELKDDQPVNINIPITLKGAVDCVGVKLGGVVRRVLRYVKVRCLPKDIPDFFEIDIKDLKMNQSRRLSSIHMPDHIRPLANLNDVAVVIAKR